MQTTTTTTQLLDFEVPHLTKVHTAEMEKYNKYKKEQVEQHFDSLALNYDGVYLRAGYPDPKKCSDYVAEFVKTRALGLNVEICDFACGTGLVGEHLSAEGFHKVFGIDVSNKMLEVAESKKVYRATKKIELGQTDFLETFPPLWRNRFDFVTCAGLINNNYMDENIFQQMLLALKNGGVMVFAARYSYLGTYWYDEHLEALEKLGRCKLLKTETFFKYDQLTTPVGKFSKTPVKIFAFQKTEQDSVMAYKRARSLTADQIKEIMNQGIKDALKQKLQAKFCFQKKPSGISMLQPKKAPAPFNIGA